MIAEPARAALGRLAAGNRRFIDAVREAVGPEGVREALATAEPFAVVLACADSRVVPEIIFGETLGKLFVVRVAGNIAESIEIGTIEYAIARWNCPLLVVLGHTQCGALHAATADSPAPASDEPAPSHLASLLVPIRSNIALAPNVPSPDGVPADPERGALLANTRAVAESLDRRSELLGRRVRRGELVIATATYDVETGTVEFLDLGMELPAPADSTPESATESDGLPVADREPAAALGSR